jgi:hypothetical protein
VDLRGCLSNPQALEAVGLAARAVGGIKVEQVRAATAAPGRRRWRVVDRLGEQVIRELLTARHAGATKPALAKRYGISLSSVA